MNLTCFWSRRACSRYVALDQHIPAGSRLDAHVARCDECRAYWNSLSLLTSELNRAIAAPHPSTQYLEPIWDRVRPTSRSLRWGPASLTATAACGLACGWLAWRIAAPPVVPIPNTEFVRTLPKALDEDPIKSARVPDSPSDGSLRPRRSEFAVRPAPRMRVAKLTGESSHRRRSGPFKRMRRHDDGVGPELNTDLPPTDWQASGRQFEAQGDPGLANVAYQVAFQETPSEEIAFDMGRSAEESGDMEQALNVYAGLLTAADTRTRIGKGWTP